VDDYEIRFFAPDGSKINRRKAKVQESQRGSIAKQQVGLMLNLSNIEALYEVAGDGGNVTVDLYPQAFSRDCGNLQSNGLVSGFDSVLADINASLRERSDAEYDSDEDRSEPDLSFPARAVTATGSQIYNAVSHRMARRAGNHDVQSGLVTAAMAGRFSPERKTNERAERYIERNRIALPQERLRQKLQHDDVDKALRLENNYKINLAKLPEQNRSGM
jgi:hypothetical protein